MKPTAGWYPVELARSGQSEPSLIWQDLSAADFASPFFEDALRRARRENPELRSTSLDDFDDWPLTAAIAPTAFIFHASRCGSTLLSQMFSCLEGSISISEPPILDEILSLQQGNKGTVPLLQRVLLAHGQCRKPSDRHLFIKHDSWHIRWLPLIQEAFPGVPCYFVYRDPVEILWSHHRQRGSQMVPGLRDPALFDIEPGSFDCADLDGYAARVLESFFARALPFVQEGKLIPLDHEGLVGKVRLEIAGRLGIELSTSEDERLDQRCRFHSKRGSDPFQVEAEKEIPSELLTRFRSLARPRLDRLYETVKLMERIPGIDAPGLRHSKAFQSGT